MDRHQADIARNVDSSPLPSGGVPVSRFQTKTADRPVGVGRMIVRVVATYVIVAALWILISDRMLAAVVSDPTMLLHLGVAKGWAFVVVTAALLFYLLQRETRHWTTERIAREAAQAALRESEGQFRQLFELAPLPIAFYGWGGVAKTINSRFRQVLGYTIEDIPTVGEWQRRAHPDETERREAVARWEAAIARAKKNDTDIEAEEYTITCKNREKKTVLISGAILREGVLATFFDITTHKQAEVALRESQKQTALLADLLANSSQPFAVGYPNGHLGSFNAAYVRLLGYSEDELRSLNWMRDLTPPDWAEAEQAGLAELRRTGKTVSYEKEYFRKDGTRVPVEGLVHQVLNDQGEVDYYYAFITDLTARKQAEAALRQSEERLKFAMEGANDGIWDVDMRTRHAELSPRGCEMFGYAPEEFKSAMPDWSMMVHPDDLAATHAALNDHLSGRSPLFQVEQRLRTKAGDYKWILSRGKVSVRDAAGKPLRMTGTHTDIATRHETELHIQQLNRVYAMLSEINKTIVRTRDPQLLFSEACRVAVKQGGFLLAWIGLVDTPTSQPKVVAHEGASVEALNLLEEVLNGPGCRFTTQALQSGEHALCNDIARDSQAEYWREGAVRLGYRAMATFPLRAEGKTIGVFNFYADETNFFDADEVRLLDELASDISFSVEICKREERRRLMEEANTRLATAVAQADEIIMITSAAAEIVYVNPAFEKVTGYTTQEVIGRNPRFLQSGSYDAAFYRAMWDKLTRGEVWSGQIINKRKDGTRFEEKASISPVRDASGRIVNYVGVKRDVTQEVAMEARLRQSQKMEAIGTLAGGIAHDFNNILGAITGYTELAKMDTDVPSVQAGLDEILRACQRAGDLVRQILTFSRQQEQRRRPVQLWPVIEEATKLLRAALPSSVEFRLEHAGKVPTVLADPTQIHQVVMNLGTNAAQAMINRTGYFAVKLERFTADDAFLALHPGCRPGVYALLSVTDNGQGMDRGTLDRIFDPFFTTKPPGEGTGLGLAVVHGIVQNHQGLITVYSRPHEGTVFHVYFPAHENETIEPPLESEQVPRGKGQRILVVDDEALLVRMVAKILSKLGYEAETMVDPTEALKAFNAAPQKYDLIITDLTMPHMTGMELATCAIRENPKIPIILMTGFFAKLTDEQLLNAGIQEVLLKPVTLKGLSQTIDRLLKK